MRDAKCGYCKVYVEDIDNTSGCECGNIPARGKPDAHPCECGCGGMVPNNTEDPFDYCLEGS